MLCLASCTLVSKASLYTTPFKCHVRPIHAPPRANDAFQVILPGTVRYWNFIRQTQASSWSLPYSQRLGCAHALTQSPGAAPLGKQRRLRLPLQDLRRQCVAPGVRFVRSVPSLQQKPLRHLLWSQPRASLAALPTYRASRPPPETHPARAMLLPVAPWCCVLQRRRRQKRALAPASAASPCTWMARMCCRRRPHASGQPRRDHAGRLRLLIGCGSTYAG